MEAAIVDVRSLGDFELVIDGKPVERWRAGKARDLLQFLLLRASKVVPTETLCDALWPDPPQSANARSSLKVAVHALRRILAENMRPAGPAGRPALALLTCPGGYLLEANDLRIDFERFDQLIDRGHQAEMNGDESIPGEYYREAVEIYAGDFLSGLDAEWASVQREWLRSRYLYALQKLSEQDLAIGDHLAVLRWCRLMLDAEPFHEGAYRALMVAHARLGQLGQVRRWYRLCASRLHGELQTAPDPVTERTYAWAIQGDALSGDPARAHAQVVPTQRR